MKECIASSSCGPEVTVKDTLTELLRKGARELIAKAVEAELEVLLAECSSLRLEDGRAAVVRNGYLPERTVQTGIGDVGVRMPKVRDRSGGGIVFNSALLPPYLKRAKNVEEFLPWLYLKGISMTFPGIDGHRKSPENEGEKRGGCLRWRKSGNANTMRNSRKKF